MTFWNEATMAPMRNYRWQLTMNGFTGNTIVWWAKTINVPSWDMSEVEHDFFDNKYYFPGRVTWQDVEVTLVDPVSPSAVSLTNDVLEKSGYSIKTKAGTRKTLSKAKSVNTGTQKVTLDLLDADGNVKESWELNNAFVKAVKYGDLDYSNDELRQITLTIKYDWATCTIKGGDGESDKSFFGTTSDTGGGGGGGDTGTGG